MLRRLLLDLGAELQEDRSEFTKTAEVREGLVLGLRLRREVPTVIRLSGDMLDGRKDSRPRI